MGKLRYGRSMLSISNIAQQFSCEQKLDMEAELWYLKYSLIKY